MRHIISTIHVKQACRSIIACVLLAVIALVPTTGCVLSPTHVRRSSWKKDFTYLQAVRLDLDSTSFTIACPEDYGTWVIVKKPDVKATPKQVSWLQKARCYTQDAKIDAKQRAAFRNAVAEEFITLVNNIYGDFEQNELLTRGYIDTAFDVAGLGLTAAAAVSSVGNILGAAGTGTLGWQHSVSKNFYNAQTVVAINSTMHALRLQQLAQIRQREALPIVCETTTTINPQNGSQQACYTLEQALNDVQDLYQAGTVQRALIEINNQSASSANTAQSKLATANNQLAAGSSTQQPAGMTVTPLSPQLKAGAKQAFKVAGATGPFDWQVDGNSGGTTDKGSIDADGNYTAPASVAAAGLTVKITAVSVADHTTSPSATVTITP